MKLFEGPGLLIVLAIVLIIFGPSRLPELGKTLGKTVKSIRDGLDESSGQSENARVVSDSSPDEADGTL